MERRPFMAQNVSDFQNPTGCWSHTGGFVVELSPGTPTNNVPKNVTVQGNNVVVHDGQVGQSMGGIQMRSGGKDFHWGYTFLRTIRKMNGELIWRNDNPR